MAIADTAQDELQLIADKLATDHGIRVSCEVRNGEAIREIIAAARQHASDLLVVGHASRNRLALALVGSTARRLIETAPCPVLVVR